MAAVAPKIRGVHRDGLIVLTALIYRQDPEVRDLILQAIDEGDYGHPIMRLTIQGMAVDQLQRAQATMRPYRQWGPN